MAIAFRAGSLVTGSFSTTASPVVTKPTGTVDGDYVLVGFGFDTNAAIGSLSNGFTNEGFPLDGTDGACLAIAKISSGDGASWTFTNLFAANEGGVYAAVAYTGVDNVTPQDVASTTGTGSGAGEQLGPSITPVTTGALVVTVRGSDNAATPRTWTPDASPVATERADFDNGGVAGFVHIQDSPWAGGAVQLGATPNASEGSAIISLALRPAGSAVVVPPQPRPLLMTLSRNRG